MPVIAVSECSYFRTRLLREATIYVVVDFCDLVRRVNGDGRSFVLRDTSEACHNALPSVYFLYCTMFMKKRTTQLFKSSHLQVPRCVLHMIVYHRQFYHLGWTRYSLIRGNTLRTRDSALGKPLPYAGIQPLPVSALLLVE
jgi:hypothetical protein